jgi:hypothetical protein
LKISYPVPLAETRQVLSSCLCDAVTSRVLLVHPRWNVIVGLIRSDKGDFRLAQIYYHGSGMPFFNGFAFSGEELHRNFTL